MHQTLSSSCSVRTSSNVFFFENCHIFTSLVRNCFLLGDYLIFQRQLSSRNLELPGFLLLIGVVSFFHSEMKTDLLCAERPPCTTFGQSLHLSIFPKNLTIFDHKMYVGCFSLDSLLPLIIQWAYIHVLHYQISTYVH